MDKILTRMAEVLEHLVFSHTFRSEHTARRVHALLGEIRGALASVAPAAGETPASTPAETAVNPQPAEPPEGPGDAA